jgi:hypothetical protein
MANGSGSPRGGAVRLTLSAKVANNLGALQSGLKQLAERMGHPTCASGCDTLLLGVERELVMNVDGELNPQPLPPRAEFASAGASVALPQDPVPAHAIRVSVPPQVLDNLANLDKVTATVLGKLGCPACCSGFDIVFQREAGQFAVDGKLNVHGFGRFA